MAALTPGRARSTRSLISRTSSQSPSHTAPTKSASHALGLRISCTNTDDDEDDAGNVAGAEARHRAKS